MMHRATLRVEHPGLEADVDADLHRSAFRCWPESREPMAFGAAAGKGPGTPFRQRHEARV
jgi:hypothetical protein